LSNKGIAYRCEKNQKIFMWGYAHTRAGGGGQGVDRAASDPGSKTRKTAI